MLPDICVVLSISSIILPDVLYVPNLSAFPLEKMPSRALREDFMIGKPGILHGCFFLGGGVDLEQLQWSGSFLGSQVGAYSSTLSHDPTFCPSISHVHNARLTTWLMK